MYFMINYWWRRDGFLVLDLYIKYKTNKVEYKINSRDQNTIL